MHRTLFPTAKQEIARKISMFCITSNIECFEFFFLHILNEKRGLEFFSYEWNSAAAVGLFE